MGADTSWKSGFDVAVKALPDISKRLKILSAIAWDRKVAEEFFAKRATRLPQPTYTIPKESLRSVVQDLKALQKPFAGEHPVLQWLERIRSSYELGCHLLLATETEHFFELSTQLYGNSKTSSFGGVLSNSILAQEILSRVSACTLNDIGESVVELSARKLARRLQRRIRRREPYFKVKVELSRDLAARVAAGMHRVRIRRDARFSALDLESLWNHEIESHALTAHNGSLQQKVPFLQWGGPRCTQTQEGLAVFYELFGHAMTQNRLRILCHRVEGVGMAEQGADFLQVYRWYLDRFESTEEAFYQTQRIFRGAKLTGGAPFTKDVVYLGGLLAVFNFLRLAVKAQNRILVETLVSGRISLEDVGVLAWLRTQGILEPPHFVPDWLKHWESLVSFFSFHAFIANVDLSPYQNFFDRFLKLEEWDLSF